MTQNTKICIELTFDKKISYSQQIKVKNFWKFMTETRPFEPYRIISDKKLVKKEDRESFKCKRNWHSQLKVFKEYGLDKAALAASDECKLCHYHANYTSSEICDAVEETYDDLLNDMEAFDRRSDNKTNTASTGKKSSTLLQYI